MTNRPSAELIFTGGRIYTQATDVVTTSVAVASGMIIAVGDDAVADVRTPSTEIVDLGGGVMLPGFVDSHVHPMIGGVARLRCDLTDENSLAGYRRAIAAYATSTDAAWIEGAGWYGDVFTGGFPTKEELDAVVGDRPAAFTSHDAHSLWVNTRALEAGGIDRNTSDPVGGRIVRDTSGDPTGLLMESAMELLDGVRPPIADDDLRAALLEAQSYLHSVGVTAWQDALVGEVFGYPDSFPVYQDAVARGELLSRVTAALYWRPGSGLEPLDELRRRRDETGGRFRASAIKLVLDGNCENMTGAVHDHYVGHPGEFGLLQFEPQELNEVVRAAHAAEFDLHIHAVGDRAVSVALDALALLDDPGGRRHQIAHIDLLRPDDVGRMLAVGAIANVSPLWARHDPVLVETKLPLLTAEQQQAQFAYGTLHRAGIPVVFGSDWPVSTPDPLAGIHTAVNRTAAPGDPHADDVRSLTDPLLPAEAIDVATAVRAATVGAARAAAVDRHVGAIETGKEADLVVLDADPYRVAASDLGAIRVSHTYVHGERVFGG